MTENILLAEFMWGFDSIIKGKVDGLMVESVENKELLTLVNQIRKIDFSSDTKISKDLKAQLLLKIKEENDNDELSEAELDWAAGGLNDDTRGPNDPEK